MSVNNAFNDPRSSSAGYWTNRKWFVFVAIFLVLWLSLYMIAHGDKLHPGYEYSRFTTQQIQQINRILYDNEVVNADKSAASGSSPSFDTLYKDSVRIIVSQQVSAMPKTAKAAVANICDDSCHINKAMIYIKGEFDNKIKEDQLSFIRQYIAAFSAQEVGSFLADLKIKIKSYFWLTGPMVYLEIVFWVIIGVICSIMFAIGNASRNTNGATVAFSDSEIPYQVAKLFYAPFCTIILVLSYNYIKHRTVIEVNTNEGMIVFSFFAGLFSGRTMSLLERFKDVLLPEHTVMAPAAGTGLTQTHYNGLGAPAAPAVQQPAVQPAYEQEYPIEKYEQHHTEQQLPGEIGEVTIMLKLDVTGLFEEEKNELKALGFEDAVVTLHNVNGRDIVNMKRAHDVASGAFTANDIRPGIYILRATLTQQLASDHVMNLFGEKTAYVTHENSHLELYIKKYEAID